MSPPRRRRGRPSGPSAKTRTQLDKYADLGDMPDDPLEANTWVLRALQQSAREVLGDTALKPRARRQELRAIARALVPLTPQARLLAAESAVRDSLESRERPRLDPAMTPAPADAAPLQMGTDAPATATPLQMDPGHHREDEED